MPGDDDGLGLGLAQQTGKGFFGFGHSVSHETRQLVFLSEQIVELLLDLSTRFFTSHSDLPEGWARWGLGVRSQASRRSGGQVLRMAPAVAQPRRAVSTP